MQALDLATSGANDFIPSIADHLNTRLEVVVGVAPLVYQTRVVGVVILDPLQGLPPTTCEATHVPAR